MIISFNFFRLFNLGRTKEKGDTFKNIHTTFPTLVAKLCRKYNLEHFVHVSALGVNEAIDSKYAISKLEGEKNVLDNFSPSDEVVAVKNEDRLESPKVVSDFYNPQPGDENNHHIVLSWLLNESHNPVQLLETYLMSNILLDNSASPLRKVLESTKLGKSPSPLTGLEADQKERPSSGGQIQLAQKSLNPVLALATRARR